MEGFEDKEMIIKATIDTDDLALSVDFHSYNEVTEEIATAKYDGITHPYIADDLAKIRQLVMAIAALGDNEKVITGLRAFTDYLMTLDMEYPSEDSEYWEEILDGFTEFMEKHYGEDGDWEGGIF